MMATVPMIEELDLLHAHICQALGDPKRIQILYALQERPRNVSELAIDLQMPQPTVSRHLRVLRERSLVSTERQGAAVVYSLPDGRLIAVLDEMRSILKGVIETRSQRMG